MSPFSMAAYVQMIEGALSAGYRFVVFDSHLIRSKAATDLMSNDTGRCLLRHDVDVDVSAAFQMACAEASVGVRSTYFLMLRSPCYNLMSRANIGYARAIVEQGHEIGLHYDHGHDELAKMDARQTTESIQAQADWLERLLDCRVAAVSFHQPSSKVLSEGIDCGPRLNTYDTGLRARFRYVSDSNRVFSILTPPDTEASRNESLGPLASCWPQDIQLLIHPIWWYYSERTTEEVWERALHANFEQMQAQLLSTERAYGARRELVLRVRDTGTGERRSG